MSAPYISLSSSPSLYQKFSQLVEIWQSSDKKIILHSLFSRHGVLAEAKGSRHNNLHKSLFTFLPHFPLTHVTLAIFRFSCLSRIWSLLTLPSVALLIGATIQSSQHSERTTDFALSCPSLFLRFSYCGWRRFLCVLASVCVCVRNTVNIILISSLNSTSRQIFHQTYSFAALWEIGTDMNASEFGFIRSKFKVADGIKSAGNSSLSCIQHSSLESSSQFLCIPFFAFFPFQGVKVPFSMPAGAHVWTFFKFQSFNLVLQTWCH